MRRSNTIQSQESIIGLSIALLLPAVHALFIFPSLIEPNLSGPYNDIVGVSMMWVFSALLIVNILYFENKGWRSVGFAPLSVKMIVLAILIGLTASALIPLFYTLFEPSESGMETVMNKSPEVVLFGIITAAVTEELLLRAYPIERIQDLTGSKWLAGIVSVFFFLILHFEGWNAAHILGIVLPLGILLTVLYLKIRNILFVMIVHLMIDLPLVFMNITN